MSRKKERSTSKNRSPKSAAVAEDVRVLDRVVAWLNGLPVWVGLVAVMAIHLVLALLTLLPVPHTGGDNAGYLALASSLLEGSYTELWDPAHPPHTKYPPVFPGLLAMAMLVGAKTWGSFKLVPLLGSTAAVGFTYLWARRVRGPVAGLVVAFLFGTSAAVLFSSRWILSDPVFLAFSMAALWAFTPKPLDESDEDAGPIQRIPPSTLILGGSFVVLAYFTRSAGLPLVVGLFLWLAVRRQWVSVAGFAAVFVPPAFLWWLRDARTGHDYLSEFWLVNPYAPDLGRASVGDLVARFGENVWAYVSDYIPAGLTGAEGLGVVVLGVVLMALVLIGWWRRVRVGPGFAEAFAFLYTGLVLVWPAVWSGDRFALPLLPLILLYAGEALSDLLKQLDRRYVVPGLLVASVALVVPSTIDWWGTVRVANQCRDLARVGGPMACYGGAGVKGFAAMAEWAGDNLDEDVVVYSRKPRIFYALSGRPSVVYPFSRDPAAFFETAEERGVTMVLRDSWDTATEAYVDPVVVRFSASFCAAAVVSAQGRPAAYLFRLVGGGDDSEQEATEAVIADCEGGAAQVDLRDAGTTLEVPLVVR